MPQKDDIANFAHLTPNNFRSSSVIDKFISSNQLLDIKFSEPFYEPSDSQHRAV